MRIALHNAFYGQQVAEAELARRLIVAAERLGWAAREAVTSSEILAFRPDFVLALHFFTPKLTPFPTYGCMWNPPAFFENDPAHVRAILGYDGYLTSGPAIREWLGDLLQGVHKRALFAPLYTSCPSRPWRAPLLDAPRLVYVGTNWDGPRFQQLFQALAERPFIDIYGPAGRWAHAPVAYRGPLPFDGETVMDVLNRSGAGLCLHRPEHRAAGIPSPRIFEIVSSGAVAICQDHPFIRETFGDSVLYVDGDLELPAAVEQVDAHLAWVASNRDQALEMSRSAHLIFEQQLSLERLLRQVGLEHQRFAGAKGSSKARPPDTCGHVQVVVRAGTRPPEILARALRSIADQTYDDVSALVVRHGQVDVGRAIGPLGGRLAVDVIDVPPGEPRSTSLWAGLQAASCEFVANLDDDDVWFPDHLATLVPLVAPGRRTAVAYGGALRKLEQDHAGAPQPPAESAALAYFCPYDRDRLFSIDNYITSNAWVARRGLVQAAGEDPRLHLLEDLLLLLRFAEFTDFAFSGCVTAQFYERTSLTDNTRYVNPHAWAEARARILSMIWKHGLAKPQAPLSHGG